MLIFTIGDVLLVLFILVVLAANVYLFLWDKAQKRPAAKDEPKPEPKKETQHGPSDKFAYLILFLFAVAIAVIFIVMKK